MGIQSAQCGGNGRVRHRFAVHGVHVMLVQGLKHEIELTPIPQLRDHQAPVLLCLLKCEHGEDTYEHSQQSDEYR